MLNINILRENPDLVKEGGRKKHIPCDEAVDRILELDEKRKKLLFESEELRAAQKKVGKEIATLEGDEKQAMIAEMGEIAGRIKAYEKELGPLEEELESQMLLVPNIPAPEVPGGETDEENVLVRDWGEVPQFDFPIKDHLELGEELDLIDMKGAAKLAGSRTYILKNEGALLELAVLQFTLNHLVEKGFSPMLVPTLVRREPMVGTAYFPGGEEQAYACERDRKYLIGTSEVPVTAYHSGEILAESDLPRLYAGYSTCYRREAGAAGRDTRGLYRIHQFNKVEQVVVCRNDDEESLRFHEFILANAEEVVQALELPYRVVNVCGGDLGQPQIQKFDIETWMPSRESYGETHSASRFHDFQSRRLDLRYRDEAGKVHFCHTLNNTAIASPRILISILEINQEADGRIRIPGVLQSYMGGREYIGPK
ncbi:MAG: serine--tRNA ligase [Planctomycetota bacterium]|nr:serine--tRNA ligase [Planctomycetota bacterium]MEC8896467.1 serine--tRNA ligase [Planctomycetota bacterium]MEE3198504.1 serine--tRNA ligase [Planctomycetota bacterium]